MARAQDGLERPSWLARWTQEHARVFFFSLGKLLTHPAGSLLTAAVIGITLALPAGLQLGVNNLQRLSYSWQGALQLSLFLRDTTDEARGQTLAQELDARADVRSTQYISRAQSAAEFRELSGFGEVLDLLETHPLPAVIVVRPEPGQPPQALETLAQQLGALPEVELAQLDQRWLDRLYAILELVERGVLLVSALLALAVIVIVGNTLRLDIEARRDEIVVMKLIGAPDGFVRRPFLYGGCWLGLLGGWFALLLLTVGLEFLKPSARNLAGLYQSGFTVQGPGLSTVLGIVVAGVALGWLGAWWTVSRHLARIEPA